MFAFAQEVKDGRQPMVELARTLQREHASEHDTLQAVPAAENATIPWW